MAPTSLRIKADVFPMACKALNYLASDLISHVFQSHWLRCYSWKTPGLECFSSSYLQQGVPWPLYLPLQPLSAFPLPFPALPGTYPLPAFSLVFLHIVFIFCGLFQECKVHTSRGCFRFLHWHILRAYKSALQLVSAWYTVFVGWTNECRNGE